MKKIYSFLVSALMAAGASAALPAKNVEAYKTSADFSLAKISDARPLDVKLERSEKKLDVKKHAGKNVLNFKPVERKSRVNKVLEDDGMQWETIGEADYYDAISVAPYAGFERPVYKVEIQESQVQNGYYRLVNIHENNPMVGDDGFSVSDPEEDSFMIINTIDMGAPVMTDCIYNITDPSQDNGDYHVDFAATSEEQLGTFDEGVIIIPAGTIAVGLGVWPSDIWELDDDYNIVIPDEYSDKVFFTDQDLVIVLPGATYDPNAAKKDYSFMMVQDHLCAGDDNKARFGFAGGKDIVTYKCIIAGGQYPVSEGNLDDVAQNGDELESGYYYNLNLNKAGWYTVFVVGLNEAGERVAGDGLYYYSYAHNPEEWTSLGNVLFTDDTFGPLYGLEDANPVEVEILVNKENSSLYRLVNPYAKNQLVEEAGIILHSNHNHYLDIDATDPDKVSIKEMPIGVSINTTDGTEHITILAISGKFANNKITFPERMVGVGTYGLGDIGPWLANKSGNFSVEFPCTLTVKAFDTANDVPVAAATVTVGEDKAETNENGEAKFTLFGVIGTKVPVTVAKDNLYWYGEADFTETAEAWAIAELSVPSIINVKAVDKNSEPVAEAYVSAAGRTVITDENGEVKLPLNNVAGTKVPVTVMKDYMFWEGEADFTEQNEVNLTAELKNPDCTLTVIAVDKDYEPVAGAFVNVGIHEVETDENGRAVINVGDVIGTVLPVTVMKDYMFWEGEADFTEGMERTVIAELKNPDCTLTVIAMDKDGEPVAGAFVNVAGKEAETGENGRAVINVGDVIGTVLPVTVMKDYMFWEGEADFTEGMERTVIAELKNPDCTLTVIAMDKDGEPVAGAFVNVAGKEAETGENGRAVINVGDVIGTVLSVTVMKDYMFWEGEADFTEGMERTVIAELKNPDCMLKVKVVNEESEPVVDAKVVAGDKEEVTNENGEVTIAMGDVIGTKVAITVIKEGYDNGVGEADFTETAEPFVIITLNGKTNGLTLSIIEDNNDIKVYDLNGRHVENPAIGNIYIINGKKVRIME